MDGCVTEFALRQPELRAHRLAVRAAADELAKAGAVKGEHDKHAALFKPHSSRPLVLETTLPTIDAKGINYLPWSVVVQTTLDRSSRPTFPTYLKELKGKQVSLQGFMQPVGDEIECSTFLLIEYPVGCWFCEMPEMTAIILAEMPDGKTRPYTRDQLRVTGTLELNATDPENFLYTLRDVKVTVEK